MTGNSKITATASVFFFSLLFVITGANAAELTGSATVEGSFFFHAPQYAGQKQHDSSLSLTAEYYYELISGSNITITPFARLDIGDSQRTHADFRELNFMYLADGWEATAGISKVFWGATEFVHLVDIINQTDLVEDIDGAEKLGQPMLRLSFVREWGVVEGFLLPLFRERTFPGKKGRLRSSVVVDTDQAVYESSAEQYHPDFALRYSHILGTCDLGIAQFFGTSREPSLLETDSGTGETRFYPYYPQITQTGVDLQMVHGEWLGKGEALYRSGQGRDFFAATFGVEYTFYGVLGSSIDLGILGEYIFDDRDETSATAFDNDVMIGLRWTANDAPGTRLLAGIMKNVDSSSLSFTLEANRRIGETMKLQLSGYVFGGADETDPLFPLKQDDFVKLEAIYYF
jgi:hypothetical protein